MYILSRLLLALSLTNCWYVRHASASLFRRTATQPLALQSSNIFFDEAAVRLCMRRWLSQCSHRLPPPGAARCKSPLHNSLYLGLWRRRGCWGICARPFNRKGAGSIEKHYTATFFQGRRKPLYNWNTIVELSLLIAASAVAARQARRQRWQRGGSGSLMLLKLFFLSSNSEKGRSPSRGRQGRWNEE